MSALRPSASFLMSAGEKPQSSSFCVSRASPGRRCSFLHEGQGAEALLDQALHRTQLCQQVVVIGRGVETTARRRRVVGPAIVGRKRERRCIPMRRGCGPLRRRLRHGIDRRRCRFFLGKRVGEGHRVVDAHVDVLAAFALPLLWSVGCRGRQRCGIGFDRRLAALEHAVAHVVLERQGAHRQAIGVLLDARCGRGRCRCSCRSGYRRRLRRRHRLVGHALDLLQAVRRHRQHLDAAIRRLGRQDDGIVAERLTDQSQRLARCACGEAFYVHDACRRAASRQARPPRGGSERM